MEPDTLLNMLRQKLSLSDPPDWSRYPSGRRDPQELTPAAVLIPLYFKAGELYILLTQRTDKVSHHKGQISFPGGKRESQDVNLLNTALRETHEEIGLQTGDITIYGEMHPMPTITEFLVHPYVGYFEYPYEFSLNSDEIERLIEVPIQHLQNPSFYRSGQRQYEGNTYLLHYFDYGPHTIWGITGQILFDFLALLDE